MSDHLTVHNRQLIILVAILAGALAIAGLAIHGATGGALLLVLALALAGRSTATREFLDPAKWSVRVLIIMAVAAVGLVKLFHH